MHCVIATRGVAAAQGLKAGAQLQALLRDWQVQPPDLGDDPASLDSPFETALAHAAACELPAAAAWTAQEHKLQAPAWAWLSPLHLQLDAQQAVALPVDLLALSEAEGRPLFDALGPLFPAAEGWQFEYLGPQQWLLGHAQLLGLRVASLQRISQRPLTPWLPRERWLRRLQNEAQMLLHEHPVNQAREARGALRVNSVWLWGAGMAPPLPEALVLEPEAPLDPGDQVAYWQRLDTGPIAALRLAAATGQPSSLTLAGDLRARRWVPGSRRWRWPWARPSTPDLGELLRELDA